MFGNSKGAGWHMNLFVTSWVHRAFTTRHTHLQTVALDASKGCKSPTSRYIVPLAKNLRVRGLVAVVTKPYSLWSHGK